MLEANPVALYRFVIAWKCFEVADGGPNAYGTLNNAGLFDRDSSDYTDFRVTTAVPAPQWSRDAVMYQVFPDRFARSAAATQLPTPDWALACDWDGPVQGTGPDASRQFYGGNLAGVLGTMGHLAAPGVDIIYLAPFFPARSNHRYDASAFKHVDPLLGRDQVLIDLVEERTPAACAPRHLSFTRAGTLCTAT